MTPEAGFILAPNVIREATTFNPFKMDLTQDTAEFNEDMMYLGANVKEVGHQTVVELSFRINEASATNPGIRFRQDLWLHTAIAGGKVRPADAEDRDWDGTKKAVRTLANLQRILGLPGDDPISALTDPSIPAELPVHANIRVYRGTNGQHKWSIGRISKVKAPEVTDASA